MYICTYVHITYVCMYVCMYVCRSITNTNCTTEEYNSLLKIRSTYTHISCHNVMDDSCMYVCMYVPRTYVVHILILLSH